MCLFPYLLPLQKCVTLLLNKKKNLFTQRYFVPGLVEIGPVVLEKICKVFQCIFTILYYLLSESGVVLPLTKLEFPLPKDSKMLCGKFGWNWSCASGEEDKKNVKNLKRQQRRRWATEEFWSEKFTLAFCSGVLNLK